MGAKWTILLLGMFLVRLLSAFRALQSVFYVEPRFGLHHMTSCLLLVGAGRGLVAVKTIRAGSYILRLTENVLITTTTVLQSAVAPAIARYGQTYRRSLYIPVRSLAL